MSNLHESSNDRINSSSKEISENQLKEEELIIIWINELKDEEKRTKAISKLSQYYDKNLDLPIYLWYSQGTMAIILQELIGTYKYLSLNKFPLEKANKIYNILLLLTSIASHKEIRYKFIESKMPIFLYPLLKNTSTAKQNEYIKLLTLTVISTLIKSEDSEIISFFISTQIIPILLKIIDKGPLLSKLSAGMMIHLIVKADEGLKFICEEKMRYSGIVIFMRQMLKNKHNQTIINQTLKTFLRLAENNEARIILKKFNKRVKTNTNIINTNPHKITITSSNRNNLNHTNDNFYESKMFSLETSIEEKTNRKINKLTKINKSKNNNINNKMFQKNFDISSISTENNLKIQKNDLKKYKKSNDYLNRLKEILYLPNEVNKDIEKEVEINGEKKKNKI